MLVRRTHDACPNVRRVISAFEAAMIGAIGSVVGGIVVGWFTVAAARSQWKRDRADAHVDRSHQAAMSIA